MGPTGVVEEPISSELALVDGALACRARAALPDPPWLLPALAELRETPRTRQARPAAPAPRPTRSRSSRAAVIASIVIVLAGVAVAALAFFPLSRRPTLEGPAHEAAPTKPAPPGVAARAKPKATTNARPHRAARMKAVSHSVATARRRQARKPARPSKAAVAAKPKRLTRAQRELSWRRLRTAAFYELYIQRGAETLYETRTKSPSVVLPAGLALRPGRYRVFVRPAIPNEAGITLGEPILRRKLTV